MEKSQLKKLNLGLFVVISTIILVVALYFIGNRQNLFGNTFKISAVFNNVNGLQLGNNVRYSGINAGTVKGIVMINDTTICVDMIIEEKMLKHLKKNAIAAIGSDGLVGSMVVNIAPSNENAPLLRPGDTIKSYSRITTTDMLTTLNTTNQNAAILTADLVKITSAINDGKGTLGLLITDEEMADNIKKTITNLKTASINTSKTINQLNRLINKINYDQSVANVLLSDSLNAVKMEGIIANLDSSSIRITRVISNINDLVSTLKESKGTFNYVATDTILVKNIDETIKNIKDGSYLLNQNLEALKHNFLFKKYFKKLEKQRRKEERKKNKS